MTALADQESTDFSRVDEVMSRVARKTVSKFCQRHAVLNTLRASRLKGQI